MISVRRIRIGEAELFKSLRLASLLESPAAFKSTYQAALRRSPESWSEQADSSAQKSDRATFIAFSDDAPIGIAALYRDEEGSDAGELLQVWVAPEYRSQGVALDLMNAVFQWAAEHGFRRVRAAVARRNERALTFYRNYGFKLVNGALRDDPDTLVLVKEIGAA